MFERAFDWTKFDEKMKYDVTSLSDELQALNAYIF